MLRTVNPTSNIGSMEPHHDLRGGIGSENMMPTSSNMNRPIVEDNGRVIVEHRSKDAYGGVVVKRYIRGPLLGKGGFAKCYQFTEADTGRIWAGKVVAKSSLVKARHKAKLQTEIKIHKALNHVNIVKIEEVFEDRENVYLIMELCENQTLLELVKRKTRLTEPETRHFLLQLLSACQYMHSVKVIHRDLKLGNLFLASKCVMKIGDFGLASKLAYDGERKRTLCGTPNYIAPEVLDGKNGHSYEVDIWSIGVILYTLLIGKPPFETNDVKSTYKRIKANSYSFPDRYPISECAKNLVRRILRPEPEQRPNLEEILRHEFCRDEIYASLPDSTIPASTVSSSTTTTTSSRVPLRAITLDNDAVIQPSSTAGMTGGILSSIPDSEYKYSSCTAATTTTTSNHNNAPASSRVPTLDFMQMGRLATTTTTSSNPITTTSGTTSSAITTGLATTRDGTSKPSYLYGSSYAGKYEALSRVQTAGSLTTRPGLSGVEEGKLVSGSTTASSTTTTTSSTKFETRPATADPASIITSSTTTALSANAQQRNAAERILAEFKDRDRVHHEGTKDNPNNHLHWLPSSGYDRYRSASSVATATTTTTTTATTSSSSSAVPTSTTTSSVMPSSSSSSSTVVPELKSTNAFGIRDDRPFAAVLERAKAAVAAATSSGLGVTSTTTTTATNSATSALPTTTTLGTFTSTQRPTTAATTSHEANNGFNPSGADANGIGAFKKGCNAELLEVGGGGKAVEDEDRGTLHSMHLNLQKSFADPIVAVNVVASAAAAAAAAAATGSGDELPMPAVWVSKWVDYSQKYGLGYKLSDGTGGVFFNDATKMLLDPSSVHLEYIERIVTPSGAKMDVRKQHELETHPSDLRKKVTLLKHFKNYLDENQGKGGPSSSSAAPIPEQTTGGVQVMDSNGESVYVRKWMRTRHSIIFRMSNNNFQVNFFDGTEVFLWSDSRWVTYLNKAKVRKTYELGSVLQYPELAKRIKYVKDILSQLIGRA